MSGRLKSWVWHDGDEREMTVRANALEPGDALVIDGDLTEILSPPRPAGMGMVAFTCMTEGDEWTWSVHPDTELKILRVGVS